MAENPVALAFRRVSEKLDADILVYFGDINDEGADDVCDKIRKSGRKNLMLVLGTYGGDPDAAYRIARRIQRTYKTQAKFKADDAPRFFVFLPTVCKSAGTLIVLGADRIYIARNAEVGPIDIQLRKHDEVRERASGLLPSEALNALAGRARQSFLQQFRSLRTDRNLPFSTKLAAEVATNITVGLFKPIFEQIDPLRLAEMERSQRIAAEYGKRLAVGNLHDATLVRLLGEYPSHSFIIDSDEMKEIFRDVVESDEDLDELAERIEGLYRNFTHNSSPLVMMLDETLLKQEDDSDEQSDSHGERRADGSDPRSTGPDISGVPRGNGAAPAPARSSKKATTGEKGAATNGGDAA